MNKFKQILKILGWKDALCTLMLAVCFISLVTIYAARMELHRGADKLAEVSAVYESQIAELSTQVNRQMNTIASLSAEPESKAIDDEAKIMAQVIYGQARWNSEAAQKALCWCILNRVDSSLYPNSVEDVCKQSSQWMGFSEENPIVSEYFNLAKSVLTVWHNNGVREMSTDLLWLEWNSDWIEFRSTYECGRSTRYAKF